MDPLHVVCSTVSRATCWRKFWFFYTILPGFFQDRTQDTLSGCRRMSWLDQVIVKGLTCAMLHGFGHCKHADNIWIVLQLWACCQEHKLACLSSVLKDMPYLGKTELVH